MYIKIEKKQKTARQNEKQRANAIKNKNSMKQRERMISEITFFLKNDITQETEHHANDKKECI
jgi:hypothetical protein